MAHSIELLLDEGSDQAIRAQWQALADAGLPSQSRVKSPTNRPHITLLAAGKISGEVDDTLRALADRLPLACVIGAPLVFGGHSMTLARLIVPSVELLELQAEVYARTGAHLAAIEAARKGGHFSESMFARFKPLACHGQWKGRHFG